MKRVFVPTLILILIVSIFIFHSTQQFDGYPRKQARINTHRLTLILANTEQRKNIGLSGSKPLKDYEGMLFQFPTIGRYGFWMKDMNYSLDFIYLRDNVVVELTENVSPDTFPSVIIPKNEFNAVIEVAAGIAEKKNINIGDKLVYN